MFVPTKVEDLRLDDRIQSPLGTIVKVKTKFEIGNQVSIGQSDGPVLWKVRGDTVEVYREELN